MPGPRSKRVSCPCGPRSITAHGMFSQTRTAAAAGVCYAGGEEIMRRRSEKDAVLPLRGEMFAWSGSECKGGCTAWAELLIREPDRRMPINPTHLRQRTLSSYLAHISSLSFAFPAWLFCTFIHLRSSYPTGRVSPLPSLPTQYTSLIQTIRREHPPFFSLSPLPPFLPSRVCSCLSSFLTCIHLSFGIPPRSASLYVLG